MVTPNLSTGQNSFFACLASHFVALRSGAFGGALTGRPVQV